MKKLDPELRLLVHTHKETADRRGATADGLTPADDPVRVTIEFRGDLETLEATGFSKHSVVAHPTKGYKIATGTIPLDRLEAVAQIDHVVLVSAPQPVRPLLNYSAREVGAIAVHERNPGGATGRGVVIGMIDSGLEVRHGTFYDDTFQSRIIALWDQKSQMSDGVPGTGGLGRVYDRATINAALHDRRALGTEDKVGHGTFVAAIAAGDGSPATCCIVGKTYIGIAPAAEIIAVGLRSGGGALGDSQNAIDGLDFIFTHPDGLAKPLVVNISLGVMRGAHDGSSPFEKAIDAHVAARDHSAVVVAAGNFADSKWHTKGDVPPNNGTFDLKFKIAEKDVRSRFLEVWYPAGAALNAKIIAPGNNVLAPVNGTHADGVLPPDEGSTFVLAPQAGGCELHVDSNTAVPDNHDNRIQVTFRRGARPKGEWTVQLINPSAAARSFHAWLEREQGSPDDPPTFSNPTSDVTISVPATAHEAIAVAAFKSKTNCCDCFPSGDIADFSSRGPVRADAVHNVKPNIAAPGVQITSAAAGAANLRGNCCDCCPDACCCLYDSEDGTSFAAPHVTGTIALMLEANPNLTRNEIATILHDTALPAPAPADAATWGAGKLNADAAVQRAASMVPGGLVGAGARRRSTARGRRKPGQAGPALQLPSGDGESAMRMLGARIRAVPNGEAYAALISRHFSEVRRLINANPRIATMWHRGEGPQMLRRLIQGTLDANAEPPLHSPGQRDYLSRFFDQLARHGGARLKTTVTTHADAIVHLLERPIAAQVVPPARSLE